MDHPLFVGLRNNADMPMPPGTTIADIDAAITSAELDNVYEEGITNADLDVIITKLKNWKNTLQQQGGKYKSRRRSKKNRRRSKKNKKH
jgi:hypothetical protein